MGVLGSVVDQQEHVGSPHPLDQGIEQGLALSVHPVQILEDEEKRLHLAFAKQHTLDAVEGAVTPLQRVQSIPFAITRRDVQQRQERREDRLESPVEGENLARHLLADAPCIVSTLDREVPTEQIDDRLVGD